MYYDVVVVGGGPAGSTTARYAAEVGAKVLILDRRPAIGIPVLCAEGVSKDIDKYNLVEGKNWMAASMDGARIFSPRFRLQILCQRPLRNSHLSGAPLQSGVSSRQELLCRKQACILLPGTCPIRVACQQ